MQPNTLALDACVAGTLPRTTLTELMNAPSGTQDVIAFIVVNMMMVMLSVGLFGPKTPGLSLEDI